MASIQAVEGLMSLRDVADLSHVERPVVSVWRKRSTVGGIDFPFPAPVAHDGTTELFDAERVLCWLADTGRGNNPEARLDAAAFVRPPTLGDAEGSSRDAVMSLLCLRAIFDQTLSVLSADELLDLADEFDPDNEALYAEIEVLGADRTRIARYVDELVEAAYGASEAAVILNTRHNRARDQRERSMTLSSKARDLVARLVTEIALDLGASSVTVRDASEGGSDLARMSSLALRQKLDCALVVAGDSGAARACRREALISGIALKVGVGDHEPAVVVTQLPHPSAPEMTPAQMLTAIDDIQLELGLGQRAVIVGPAAVLCDRLVNSGLDRERDELIRGLGRLRAAVRLPEGQVIGRSRERLGLWVLGPEPTGSRDERWVAVADMAGRALTPAVKSDLVTDVITAMGPVRTGKMHAFHFATVTSTAMLLSRGGDLVPAGAGPTASHSAGGAQAVLAAEAMLGAIHSQAHVFSIAELAIQPMTEQSTTPSEALGELVARKGVRKLPGTRMAELVSSPSGGVRVLGAADVLNPGETSPVYADPLVMESAYPLARRTEPGDVIFVSSPRPAAIVDRDGMSMVRSPAMVLRCVEGSRMGPEVLSATINAQRPAAHVWKAWAVPLLAPQHGRDLDEVLKTIDEERILLRHRLRMLSDLDAVLIDGAAKGAFTVARFTETLTKGDPS